MRLVGLYYRAAAEDFFPAMGAIQMPLLGWSEVSFTVERILQQDYDLTYSRLRWQSSSRNVGML